MIAIGLVPALLLFGLIAFRLAGFALLVLVLLLFAPVMLVGTGFDMGSKHLLGDALAVAGAVFYAGYLLTVKFLRRSLSTLAIMAWSAKVSISLIWASVKGRGSIRRAVRVPTVRSWERSGAIRNVRAP